MGYDPQDDDLGDEGSRYFGMAIGEVTDRADPEGLGRVRVTIPGMIEESAWAPPLGTMGGGSKQRGSFAVPEVGATVGVWFNQGDLDAPYYLAAGWAKPDEGSEVPAEAEDPDVRVITTENYAIVIDEREGKQTFAIRDRNTDGDDAIVFDGKEHSLTISATTAVSIKCDGQVDIDACTITIGGRVVRPVPDPI